MDEQKDLEKLIDKLFDADPLDSPSLNFTSKVIEKIEAQKKARLEYTPLLPKWVFVILAFSMVVFSVYVLNTLNSGNSGINYFESLNFSSSWVADGFSRFNFSSTLGYSILAVGLLICVQASLLNKFLNRTNTLA